jgi:thiamine pyrophosphate-dependent acetolactate synthase large subunit-like protein
LSTGADRIVETLDRLGVNVAFGLPGIHNLAIWHALPRSGIRLIGVRHEQAAVYAADGYARTTGDLGVALVTTGPGAANTLAATGEAWASGTPVVVLATDIPSHLRRPGTYRGVLHESRDQAAMFAPVVKRAMTATDPKSVPADVLAAAHLALTPPTGPVYLGIPTDYLSAAVPPSNGSRSHTPPRLPDESRLQEAVDLLRTTRAPLICAGGGALKAGAGPAVAALAERLAAPVVMSYAAKGLLPPGHPCAVPATLHSPEVGALWDDADLVIAIGTDFDGITTQNWALPSPPRLLAINVDEQDGAKNYPPDLTLVGDAARVTELLSDRIPGASQLEPTRERLEQVRRVLREAIAEDEPDALSFLDAMAELVPGDANLIADMCIPGYWLAGFHTVARPRAFAYPMWGTLGFALPASIGAATRGDRTVCVCGDGGFLFACGELATLAQERLPVAVIVVDDGGYGMLRFDQAEAGAEPFGVDLETRTSWRWRSRSAFRPFALRGSARPSGGASATAFEPTARACSSSTRSFGPHRTPRRGGIAASAVTLPQSDRKESHDHRASNFARDQRDRRQPRCRPDGAGDQGPKPLGPRAGRRRDPPRDS